MSRVAKRLVALLPPLVRDFTAAAAVGEKEHCTVLLYGVPPPASYGKESAGFNVTVVSVVEGASIDMEDEILVGSSFVSDHLHLIGGSGVSGPEGGRAHAALS